MAKVKVKKADIEIELEDENMSGEEILQLLVLVLDFLEKLPGRDSDDDE